MIGTLYWGCRECGEIKPQLNSTPPHQIPKLFIQFQSVSIHPQYTDCYTLQFKNQQPPLATTPSPDKFRSNEQSIHLHLCWRKTQGWADVQLGNNIMRNRPIIPSMGAQFPHVLNHGSRRIIHSSRTSNSHVAAAHREGPPLIGPHLHRAYCRFHPPPLRWDNALHIQINSTTRSYSLVSTMVARWGSIEYTRQSRSPTCEAPVQLRQHVHNGEF